MVGYDAVPGLVTGIAELIAWTGAPRMTAEWSWRRNVGFRSSEHCVARPGHHGTSVGGGWMYGFRLLLY